MSDLIPQEPVDNGPRRERATDAVVRAWRDLLRAVREFLRDRTQVARPWLERTEEKFAGMERSLGDQGRRAAAATDAYVRNKPWQALGIAAALALLVGKLLRRR